MAKNSDVETFCALRLFIDSWRWEGVPWYLRSGKYLAETVNEVLVELNPPPQKLFETHLRRLGRQIICAFSFLLSPPLGWLRRVREGQEIHRRPKRTLSDRRRVWRAVTVRAAFGGCDVRRSLAFYPRGPVDSPGQLLIQCSKNTLAPFLTNGVVGVQKRQMPSSQKMVVGIIPPWILLRRRDSQRMLSKERRPL